MSGRIVWFKAPATIAAIGAASGPAAPLVLLGGASVLAFGAACWYFGRKGGRRSAGV